MSDIYFETERHLDSLRALTAHDPAMFERALDEANRRIREVPYLSTPDALHEVAREIAEHGDVRMGGVG